MTALEIILLILVILIVILIVVIFKSITDEFFKNKWW